MEMPSTEPIYNKEQSFKAFASGDNDDMNHVCISCLIERVLLVEHDRYDIQYEKDNTITPNSSPTPGRDGPTGPMWAPPASEKKADKTKLTSWYERM
jgi:hypothetical protein